MSIRFSDAFEVLAKALPGCPPAADDWQEPLAYVLMQEILSHVCNQANAGITVDLIQFSVLLEKLASEGDSDVQDLVKDALDGLAGCNKKDDFPQYFGPKVQALWDQI